MDFRWKSVPDDWSCNGETSLADRRVCPRLKQVAVASRTEWLIWQVRDWPDDLLEVDRTSTSDTVKAAILNCRLSAQWLAASEECRKHRCNVLIFADTWVSVVGYGKKWLLAYKSSNICEVRQDRTSVTIENHTSFRCSQITYTVLVETLNHAQSMVNKINDIGWPWRVTSYALCFKTHAMVGAMVLLFIVSHSAAAYQISVNVDCRCCEDADAMHCFHRWNWHGRSKENQLADTSICKPDYQPAAVRDGWVSLSMC